MKFEVVVVLRRVRWYVTEILSQIILLTIEMCDLKSFKLTGPKCFG